MGGVVRGAEGIEAHGICRIMSDEEWIAVSRRPRLSLPQSLARPLSPSPTPRGRW